MEHSNIVEDMLASESLKIQIILLSNHHLICC